MGYVGYLLNFFWRVVCLYVGVLKFSDCGGFCRGWECVLCVCDKCYVLWLDWCFVWGGVLCNRLLWWVFVLFMCLVSRCVLLFVFWKVLVLRVMFIMVLLWSIVCGCGRIWFSWICVRFIWFMRNCMMSYVLVVLLLVWGLWVRILLFVVLICLVCLLVFVCVWGKVFWLSWLVCVIFVCSWIIISLDWLLLCLVVMNRVIWFVRLGWWWLFWKMVRFVLVMLLIFSCFFCCIGFWRRFEVICCDFGWILCEGLCFNVGKYCLIIRSYSMYK